MSTFQCWHIATKCKGSSHLIGDWLCFCLFTTRIIIINVIYIALLLQPKCFLNKIRASSSSSSIHITFMMLMIFFFFFLLLGSKAICVYVCFPSSRWTSGLLSWKPEHQQQCQQHPGEPRQRRVHSFLRDHRQNAKGVLLFFPQLPHR